MRQLSAGSGISETGRGAPRRSTTLTASEMMSPYDTDGKPLPRNADGEPVGVGGKLKNIGKYVSKRWRSTDPDSYDRYRRGRERTRKQGEHTRESAERHGEQERENAERGREYVERYEAERSAAEKEEE